MSVEYVTGSLLDYPEGISVIAHVVGRDGQMDTALARQMAEETPAACEPYLAACKDKRAPFGSVIAAETAASRRVLHLVARDTSPTITRQLDYEGLLYCLEQVRDLLQNGTRTWTLGLPLLGCEPEAGGNPIIVRALIEAVFGESSVRCVVVTPIEKPTGESASAVPST